MGKVLPANLTELEEKCAGNTFNQIFVVKDEDVKIHETWIEIWRNWPPAIYFYLTFIALINVAALGTVQTLYLLNVLKFSVHQTIVYYSIQSTVLGILPFLSTILCDKYLGRYRILLYSFLLWMASKIVMAFASAQPAGSPLHPWLDLGSMMGVILALVGITPADTPFAVDQIDPRQKPMLSAYFSAYYIAIYAADIIAIIVMPILRCSDTTKKLTIFSILATPCMGNDTCYPLSFGISSSSVAVAVVVFILGSRYYVKSPPTRHIVFVNVYRAIRQSLANKMKSGMDPKFSSLKWHEFYFLTHNCDRDPKCREMGGGEKSCQKRVFLADVNSLLRLLVTLIPIIVYWALHTQMRTVWVVQALQMNGRIWEGYFLLPDHMAFFNPVFMAVLAPTFVWIYRRMGKVVRVTPLRKMVTGGIFMCVAFLMSGILQLEIDKSLPRLPTSPQRSLVSFMNNFDSCSFQIQMNSSNNLVRLLPNSSLVNEQMLDLPSGLQTFTIKYNEDECGNYILPQQVSFELEGGQLHYVYVGENGVYISTATTAKPTGGLGEFSLALNLALSDQTYTEDLVLCRLPSHHPTPVNSRICDPHKPKDFYTFRGSAPDDGSSDLIEIVHYKRGNGTEVPKEGQPAASIYRFKWVRHGEWAIFYSNQNNISMNFTYTGITLINPNMGGIYVVLLTGKMIKPEKRVFQVAPANEVSLLWQIPQIFMVTASTVLYAISGFEFAYTQSGESMKSMVQSVWYLYVSLGTVLFTASSFLDFGGLAKAAFFYAGAVLVVTVALALLSMFFYEYREDMKEESVRNAHTQKSRGETDSSEMISECDIRMRSLSQFSY